MEHNGYLHVPNRGVKPGDIIRLETEHELSNGQFARVVKVEPWGVHCETGWHRPNDKDGTAGRMYRAAWNEFLPADTTDLTAPHMLSSRKPPSPTGGFCPNCQGPNMVRTGACTTCQDCGYNEGCG